VLGDIIQPTHLLFILVVALLVLGPKRLPEVGRSLGRGLQSFRSGLQGVQDEAHGIFGDVMDDPTAPTPAEPPVPVEPAPVLTAPAEPVTAAAPVTAPAPAAAPDATHAAAPAATHAVAEPDPADYAD